jgi:hypothetical protein
MSLMIYPYNEAQKRLADLLREAFSFGEVRLRGQDGQVFVITPESLKPSPFEVEGIDLGISTSEVVSFVREGRERYEA